MAIRINNCDSIHYTLCKSKCAALQSELKQLNTDQIDLPAFSQLRSDIFFHLKRISDAKISGFENDRCLTLAKRVAEGQFSSHTASHNRLVPLANAYINQFFTLPRSSVLEKTSEVFAEELSKFFIVHQQFVSTYCAEIKSLYKNEPNVVKITQAEDIDLFVTPFLEIFRSCPIEQIDHYLEKISSCDPELVFLFSYLVVEKSLLTNGTTLPKAFDSCRPKIIEHSPEYSRLTSDEQSLIHSLLIGKAIAPTEAVKREIELIKKWAIESQRDQHSTALYSALMSNSFSIAEKTLRLAKQMKKNMNTLPEGTNIKLSNAYLFIFFCGITLERNAQFEFFQQPCISHLRKRCFQMSEDEKTAISRATAGLEKPSIGSPMDEFLMDLQFYSNKLAFADEAPITLRMFRLLFV